MRRKDGQRWDDEQDLQKQEDSKSKLRNFRILLLARTSKGGPVRLLQPCDLLAQRVDDGVLLSDVRFEGDDVGLPPRSESSRRGFVPVSGRE